MSSGHRACHVSLDFCYRRIRSGSCGGNSWGSMMSVRHGRISSQHLDISGVFALMLSNRGESPSPTHLSSFSAAAVFAIVTCDYYHQIFGLFTRPVCKSLSHCLPFGYKYIHLTGDLSSFAFLPPIRYLVPICHDLRTTVHWMPICKGRLYRSDIST